MNEECLDLLNEQGEPTGKSMLVPHTEEYDQLIKYIENL